MGALDGLAALSSVIALVGSIFGFLLRSTQVEREEQAHSLRGAIEQLYGRLASSDIPLDENERDDFYALFRSDLSQLVAKHFDRVRISDYMRDPVVHQQVRGEVEWVRKMYLGPEDGRLTSPPR